MNAADGPGGHTDTGGTGPADSSTGGADRIKLGHGSGGRMSAALLRQRFLPAFGNEILDRLGDAAVVRLPAGAIAVSTDSFVVTPLEFPGGNIGSLAVNGTLNDVAMMGATPLFLTAGFILEEGLHLDLLDRVIAAMAGAANAAGVPIITGDTKVVNRGDADGLYINTTGIGIVDERFAPDPRRARPGDAVLVSGPIGTHGIAILSAREGLDFRTRIQSDTACLVPLVQALRTTTGEQLHVLRDPTRGGVASALNEIAVAAGVGIEIYETAIPVASPVAAACDLLGLDPLYIANEGILIAIVAPDAADAALAALRRSPLAASADRIGTIVNVHQGHVVLRTGLGTTRIVDMLPGDQLPRIC